MPSGDPVHGNPRDHSYSPSAFLLSQFDMRRIVGGLPSEARDEIIGLCDFRVALPSRVRVWWWRPDDLAVLRGIAIGGAPGLMIRGPFYAIPIRDARAGTRASLRVQPLLTRDRPETFADLEWDALSGKLREGIF